MSKKITLGTKKKSFNSIMEAARTISAQTGEDVKKVYMRSYMRMRAGKKVASALKSPPRKYVRRQEVVEQQVGV